MAKGQEKGAKCAKLVSVCECISAWTGKGGGGHTVRAKAFGKRRHQVKLKLNLFGRVK